MHLVSIITGLDREERRDEGRPNTAGCGAWLGRVLRVLGGEKQAAPEVTLSPTPTSLLHLFFSPWISFLICVFSSSQISLFIFPPPAPDGL